MVQIFCHSLQLHLQILYVPFELLDFGFLPFNLSFQILYFYVFVLDNSGLFNEGFGTCDSLVVGEVDWLTESQLAF